MTPAAAAATRLVLFDLDGTLVDTADDLAAALNRCQSLRGLPPTPPQELRPWTSHGARGLILLKSVDVPRPLDWGAAAARGFVDPYFPGLVTSGLKVVVVNLRAWRRPA